MISLSDLHSAPRKVRHEDGTEFMLSAVELELDRKPVGAYALAHYKVGQKRPRKGQHTLVNAATRHDWFSHLTLVP